MLSVDTHAAGEPAIPYGRQAMKLKYPKAKYFQKYMEEFVYTSDTMKSVMEIVQRVARYDVNVLIMGESGTGKEMLAKIIHLQSPRAENPFIPLNCGVLSGLMFEDKLFGHEKGAFTGAIQQNIGCFELAHKGTLFLDEISELRPENQVDFLRVLEDFRFTRIGGNEVITVDVRIISATNVDLKHRIREGRFRKDLYYRLQVIPITLPPLRDRRDVIAQMVDHFMNQFEMIYQKPRPSVHQEVIDLFHRHSWPGNVRELKNLVERVFILSDNPVLRARDLPEDFLDSIENPADPPTLAGVRRKAEQKAIREALIRSGGDKAGAARLLQISPRTLRHKIRTYNIGSY